MPFFQLNWIIVFITLLFLFIFIFTESKFKLVSEIIGIAPIKVYILVLVLGAFAAFMNYVALVLVGSWEVLVMMIVIAVIAIAVLSFIIRRKIKNYRETKELNNLRKEKEILEAKEAQAQFQEGINEEINEKKQEANHAFDDE